MNTHTNSEAQAATTSYTIAPPLPIYSPRSASWFSEKETTTNAIDDFFGYTPSRSATRDSRHDRRASLASDVPPPYGEMLPEYSEKDEPVTLAMYLFKFGFLFFPFWILGAIILLSPLRDAPDSAPSMTWLPNQTPAEREAFIAHMRTTELKWAKRCLIALALLACAATAVGFTIWAVIRG